MLWLASKFANFISLSEPGTSTCFKAIVLSRRDVQLNRIMASSPTINLDADNNRIISNDVEKFVYAKVNKLRHIDGFDEAMEREVSKTLLELADSTFLWVGYVVADMSRMATCTEIYETLQSLRTTPKGLDALYDRMLTNIPSRRRRIVFDILLWLATAMRPLTLGELAHAIDVHPLGRISPTQIIRDNLTWCGSIVQVRLGSTNPCISDCNFWHAPISDKAGCEVVALVHHSARDYLFSMHSEDSSALDEFRNTPETGHIHVLQRCLDVMHEQYERNSDFRRCWEFSSVAHGDGLIHYAIYCWLDHLSYLPESEVEKIVQRNRFFTNNPIASKWFESYWYTKYNGGQIFPPLHIACALGIAPWVKQILDSTTEPREELLRERDWIGEDANHALDYAASHGHGHVVNLLLRYGADPLCHGVGTLLKTSYEPTGPVLDQILRRIANVEPELSHGTTALMQVIEHSTTNAMIRVISHHLNTNTQLTMEDSQGNNILHAAILAERDAVPKLEYLLQRPECKELVNKSNLQGKAPLHSVAAKVWMIDSALEEHFENPEYESDTDAITFCWAQTLLEHGALVNTEDRNGETPLYTAYKSERLRHDIINLLLSHGAVMLASAENGSPLDSGEEPLDDEILYSRDGSPERAQGV